MTHVARRKRRRPLKAVEVRASENRYYETDGLGEF
jgi:hypothetical protein